MKNVAILMILSVCIPAPSVAFAETFAIAAGVNRSTADTVRFDGQTGSTMDSTITGTTARLGFSIAISDWLGVDAGWTRLGSERGSVSIFVFCIPEAPECPDVEFDVRQRGSAYWVSITPTIQWSDFTLFGKLGVGRTSREIGAPVSTSIRKTETETDELVGAGVSYAITRNVGLRLDYERMGDVARNAGISVEYRF